MARLIRICGCVALLLIGPTAFLPAESPDLQGAGLEQAGAITPNMFQGTDAQRINQAIAAAAGTGRPVVIPRQNRTGESVRDAWLLDEAILVPSNTLLVLVNCHLKLSDRCRDNFIRSANCGMGITEIRPQENIHLRGVGRVVLEGADHPRATGDSAKTLGKQTYGADAGKPEESQRGDWRNIGILLAYVEHFSIENIHIKDSHCWAISLERCARGEMRDLSFASTGFKQIDGKRATMLNQDGIDLRQGCHDITIENVSGETGDDLVALTAIPSEQQQAGSTASTMVTKANNRGQGSDDIRHVIIRNVRGFSHGDHIVRLLNNRGLRIHDVMVDGLIGISTGQQSKAAVKIGDNSYGGHAPLGDTSQIIINNVISNAQHTILIGGTLSESILANLIGNAAGDSPVTYAAGPQSVRDVVVSNAITRSTPSREESR